MDIELIDPTLYPGWNNLISRHFNPGIFHCAEWCRVLKLTYNFRPLYFLAKENSQPIAVIPLFEINSPFTGRRAVSLPFSDSCDLLNNSIEKLQILINHVIAHGQRTNWKYIEFRSRFFPESSPPSEVFVTHDIDLNQPAEKLWNKLKDTNRRNIKKALKYGLKVNFENSLESLNNFYQLQVITRKRHGLPPQPFKFFYNIHQEILAKKLGIIASIYYQKKMIAASIFFNFQRQAIFKFGASDHRYHHLRPNNLIMWESIIWLRENHNEILNLGRTDPEDAGLLSYKRSWGGIEDQLNYFRYDLKKNKYIKTDHHLSNALNKYTRYLPSSLLKLIGNIAYRHIS